MIKVSTIQMEILSGETEKNLNKACAFIEKAVESCADIICLPELFTTGFCYNKLSDVAEKIPGRTTAVVSEKARKYHAAIIAGSIIEKRDGRFFNTSIVINKNGEMVGTYSKLHLASITDEDKYFTAGNNIKVFDIGCCKIGIMICYDFRFPEMAILLSNNGAQIIFIIAHFPVARVSHWKNIIRTRAIDNQVFIVAVNAVGNSELGKLCGNSAIISPWGDTICGLGQEEEGIINAEIDLCQVNIARQRLPLLQSKRGDIYKIKENNKREDTKY